MQRDRNIALDTPAESNYRDSTNRELRGEKENRATKMSSQFELLQRKPTCRCFPTDRNLSTDPSILVRSRLLASGMELDVVHHADKTNQLDTEALNQNRDNRMIPDIDY